MCTIHMANKVLFFLLLGLAVAEAVSVPRGAVGLWLADVMVTF